MSADESAASANDVLPVLWLDDDIVVVHKPAGWLVHRTGLDAHETRFVLQTLRNQLGRHVFPVHRLDKGTSGILVMALHPDAAKALGQAFEAQQVAKTYLAMVRGWPEPGPWQVDHPLKPDDAPADAPAQPAHTSFTRLAIMDLAVPVDRYPGTRAALVAAQPHTGRRHQIRRHLKHVSHPIIGDATHGKGQHNRWWAGYLNLQRLWLHAWSLQLPHPGTGEPLQFISPIDGLVLPDQRSAEGLLQATLNPQVNADWSALMKQLPWRFDPAAAAPKDAIPSLQG